MVHYAKDAQNPSVKNKLEKANRGPAPANLVRPQPVQVPEPTRTSPGKQSDKKSA
jgi:hypothetical protein